MKLYVCHSTKGPDFHPCAKAYRALLKAGFHPDVHIIRGTGRLPRAFDRITKTPGRDKVEKLTGEIKVPALELDDGTGIAGSRKIIAWADNKTMKY